MPLYSTSLLDLMRRVGRLGLGEWFEGIATGGSTTTFVDTNRWETDDYFQNLNPPGKVRIVSTTDGAAPYGDEREITDWVQSGGTGTVHAAWSASALVEAGDRYVIMSSYTWAELREAINSAIDQLGSGALIEIQDETTTLVSAVYEYPVPAGFTHIYRIWMADGYGDYPEPIPPDHYKIIRSGLTPMIHFTRFPTEHEASDWHYSDLWADSKLTAGRILRIEGFGRQALLDKETDICNINPEYVWRQAAATLHSQRIRRPENEPDDHRTQFQVHQAAADELKRNTKIQLPPNTKRTVS